MQPADWKTPFARELLEMVEARIADRTKEYDRSTSHETTRHIQGRIKELRWLLALKDERSE